ncbi:MAG: LPS assembly lipoprotein LptE [Fibrobacterota bacterium]
MRSLLAAFVLLLTGCAYYSFQGSSVPSHIETIAVPVFKNDAQVQNVAEELTDLLRSQMSRHGLTTTSRDADAVLTGTVLSYESRAREYSGEWEDTEIGSYAVTIRVTATLQDKVKKDELYSGTVEATGIYSADSEDENDGIARAAEKIVQKIINNSFPGW